MQSWSHLPGNCPCGDSSAAPPPVGTPDEAVARIRPVTPGLGGRFEASVLTPWRFLGAGGSDGQVPAGCAVVCWLERADTGPTKVQFSGLHGVTANLVASHPHDILDVQI